MVALCFIFWKAARLLSKAPVSHSHEKRMSGLVTTHPRQHLLLSVLALAILVGAKCYLTAVLSCVSLVIDDVGLPFMGSLAIHVSLQRCLFTLAWSIVGVHGGLAFPTLSSPIFLTNLYEQELSVDDSVILVKTPYKAIWGLGVRKAFCSCFNSFFFF